MPMKRHSCILIGFAFLLNGCALFERSPSRDQTFDGDLAFLQQHVDFVLLHDPSTAAQVVVVPAYQGRVMTSTLDGNISFGWINDGLIASGKRVPHINAFGGEDRFWLGPEGGQFAIFFPTNTPFTFENWQTPAIIDAIPYAVSAKSQTRITFQASGSLQNWSGTAFTFDIERTIELLRQPRVETLLQVKLPRRVSFVAFESRNQLTNRDEAAWTEAGGLLSIWILGMFRPSPQTTVAIPFRPGPISRLGPPVNDRYFGNVPPDRLIVEADRLFFRADGRHRSKIGISPARALPIAGSYDAGNQVLTLVQYSRPGGVNTYVNSMWEYQDEPFGGDVVNAYNDGPVNGGKPLGPFYELETSSPAVELPPDSRLVHIHRTFHFSGPINDLNALAEKTLGIPLHAITNAFAMQED